MRHTIPLCENYLFGRIYRRGKNAVTPLLAVYCMNNRLGTNRLGITASKKLGGAVQRNRARRIIKEAYRLTEPAVKAGFDIVIVARKKTVCANMWEVKRSLEKILDGLSLLEKI
jgi:ribonuclease P protein component